jgi:hypothetical protein
MHPLDGLPIYEQTKQFRKDQSGNNAWKVIETFFDAYGKEAAENTMWSAVSIAMQADNDLIDSQQRSNILYFFENFKCLNEVVAYLNQERK